MGVANKTSEGIIEASKAECDSPTGGERHKRKPASLINFI